MREMFRGAFGCWTATFSLQEAAHILNVSIDQVQIWIHDGTLPAKKMLGMTRIDHATIWKAVQAELVSALFNVPASLPELLDAENSYFQEE
jgi:excisionase family DNA binding protein